MATPNRSSAEVFEIEREVNKHKRQINSSHLNNEPEMMKKNMQVSMQLQLHNIVTKINDKEKVNKE